ncbi:hypothetical protein LLH00_15150 [bacterium]|nr:hypothetical protein [bacterium]
MAAGQDRPAICSSEMFISCIFILTEKRPQKPLFVRKTALYAGYIGFLFDNPVYCIIVNPADRC